jgi:CubicO group peptidase (beta-lactamase class C family)
MPVEIPETKYDSSKTTLTVRSRRPWARRPIWKVFLVVACLILALCFGFMWLLGSNARLGSAYAAKILASAVFIAGRSPESVLSEELGFIPRVNYRIDGVEKTLTAWTAPDTKVTAVFRDGLGVALALDGDIGALKKQARPDLIPALGSLSRAAWPMGDTPSGRSRPSGINEAALELAVARMFEEPNAWYKRRTRAVVILLDGEIIAERYGEGFDAGQKFPAWSISKSIQHALYGIAVRDKKLAIADLAPIAEWKGTGDPRSAITIDMLLRMSSGLKYNEFDFLPPADLTTMLYLEPSAADYAIRAPLAHPPDTSWAYSSATANILSQILRQAYGDDDYYRLPYRALFAKIGMRNTVVEADPAGTLVFSSYVFSTARDLARFGLLYAQDGTWLGERILPEGWTTYARTRTPTAPEGEYGAQWWLPSDTERAKAEKRGTPLPPDTFFGEGFEGQKLFVIPSRKLVILRLGLAYLSAHSSYDYVYEILDAVASR